MEIKLRSCPTNRCATTSVRVHGKKTFAKICACVLDVKIVLLRLYCLRWMTVNVKMSDDATEDEREDEGENEVYDYDDHSGDE